ncbi:MAG: nucleotide exchange factor GrpE [Candidatus Wallbacteria bacterium]|nr:nucleotide exchange factor GrpE [Candidatus Wallbacteria bacterium]
MSDDNQSEEQNKAQEPAVSETAPPAEASSVPGIAAAGLSAEEAAKLRKELDDARQQADALRRHAAELDNVRKRVQRERDRDLTERSASVLRGMLPVVDNFERAMASLAKTTDAEAVKTGTEQIYRLFVDWLDKQGVKPIPAQGEKYDPNLHEAVMQMASAEVPGGCISSELERGYTIGERVLRHAKVVVSTGAAVQAPQTAEQSDGGNEPASN